MAFLQLFFLKTHPEVAVIQQTTLSTADCQCPESHWTKAPKRVIHTKVRRIKIEESDSQNAGSTNQKTPLARHLKHRVTQLMYGLNHLAIQSEAQHK